MAVASRVAYRGVPLWKDDWDPASPGFEQPRPTNGPIKVVSLITLVGLYKGSASHPRCHGS